MARLKSSKIGKILNSGIVNRISFLVNHNSTYRITKHTHIYENTLIRMRNGQSKPQRLALKTALKLDSYCRSEYKEYISPSSNRKARNLRSHVKQVITSNLTSYFLGDAAHISTSAIDSFRHHRSSLKNITLKNALNLNTFYLKHRQTIRISNSQPNNVTSSMKEHIRKIIDSGFSSYRLAKRTGLNPSVTSRLYRGVTNLDNANKQTIFTLDKFYHDHEDSINR